MAGVPPIPPLLCNTPPPIDFGEDDDSGLPPTLTLEDEDEFGDFALAGDINENADASSLPHTPLQFELSSSTTSGFTDVPPNLEDCGFSPITPPPLQTVYPSHDEVKGSPKLNEAINYNVTRKESDLSQNKEAVSELDDNNITLGNFEIPTQHLEKDNKDTNFVSEAAKNTFPAIIAPAEVSNAKITNDEKSRILDSSPLFNEQEVERKPNMPILSQSPPPLANVVVVEDLADDSSDEECHRSPKKSSISPTSPLTSSNDINSADFFAIHVVDVVQSPKEDNQSIIAEDINMNNFSKNNNIVSVIENTENCNSNGFSEHEDDFGDFANFETATDIINPSPFAMDAADVSAIDEVDNNENLKTINKPHMDHGIQPNDNDDDFDDFQDFCTSPTVGPSVTPLVSAQNSFDLTTINNDNINKSGESAPQAKIADDDIFDDDFGDFEVASFATPSSGNTINTTMSLADASAVTSVNINERLCSVLKIMFSLTNDNDNDGIQSAKETKVVQVLPSLKSPNATLPFESIEAAKALEFQWPQSEMRHALIRSIGIDSRNILFGENWNPSMPRFAANLSFSPLQPMKPQTAKTSTATFPDVESVHYSNSSAGCAADVDTNSYSMKTDVPDVEFDWQSAGLVNPLDGVKGEANARETETIHPSPPVARLDTPDDQHQPHTTFTNIGDNISETLSSNDTELTATPTRDVLSAPLTLDKAAYQFTTQDQGTISITPTSSNSSSITNASCASNSKPYDNSKSLPTLRLGANIVDDDADDETVVTSTYAGPLKETHIYTPSKTDTATAVKTSKAPAGDSEPIDFDYEIAAAGIIIDEKVVKKEYRDVEYNPGFSLEVVNEYTGELTTVAPAPVASEPRGPVLALTQQPSVEADTDEYSEFSEFQSVPPPPPPTKASLSVATTASYGVMASPTNTITSVFQVESNTKATNISVPTVLPAAVAKAKEASNTPSRTSSPSIVDNMILSPAILLPQSIPLSSNNALGTNGTPSIEWGDTSTNINADELARIEELFPQPKMTTAKDANTSQKSSPTHTYAENQAKNASISISASVAMKEQDSTLNDDYWSEFVSVPVTPQLPSNASRLNNNSCISKNKSNNNNNQLTIAPKRIVHVQINSANNSNNAMRSPRQLQHANVQRTVTPTPQRKPTASANVNSNATANASYAYNSNSNMNSNSNDDDWSDFVSSTPAAPVAAPTHATAYMQTAHAPQFNSAAWQNANFYNNPLGFYHQQVSANTQTRAAPLTPQQQQLQLQQQIHIIQDFSTAPVTARPNGAMNNSNNAHISNMPHSNTYSPLQVGNARVAPSISLIPDLGFVAPAMPVHTAFVNVLPKTSFNGKK